MLFTWGPCTSTADSPSGSGRTNPVLGRSCKDNLPQQVTGDLAGHYVTAVAMADTHVAVIAGVLPVHVGVTRNLTHSALL